MRENNIDILRKILVKDLIYGVEYDCSTHKLVFKFHMSISPERIEKYRDITSSLGIDQNNVESILRGIWNQLPVGVMMSADCYTLDTTSYANGTVFYIECRENYTGEIACMELMKISKGRMLVLSSDDNGLLPGDKITLVNNRLTQTGRICAKIEDVEECMNLVYESLQIATIRIKMPSLAHEAYDSDIKFSMTLKSHDNVSVDRLEISNPVMALLMGSHLDNPKKYLTVDSVHSDRGKTNDGIKYRALSTCIWEEIIDGNVL